MNACKPTLLFEQEEFYVAQCQHCQRVGLTFRNLLIGFSQEEFTGLCRTMDEIDFEQNSVMMPNGQLCLIINAGHPDIHFNLSQTEFDLFRAGLRQALRRLNLYQLLKIQAN